MRSLATTCLLLLAVAGCKASVALPTPTRVAGAAERAAAETDVTITALPATADEFLALRDQLATTPEGGAAMHVVALILYSQNAELGLQCLTIALDSDFIVDGKVYKGKQPGLPHQQRLKSNLGPRPYVASSYVLKTSKENGYELPPPPLEIRCRQDSRDPPAPDRIKVFVTSSGADSARPITLRKNDKGMWKSYEWSSLEVGVAPPPKKKPKDDF